MNIKDFAKPTILKGTQYGTTITIEIDHSDTSIDEVMDGFLTIVKGLGYLDSTINEWIKDKSKDIKEDEDTILKNSFAEDWYETIYASEHDCWCGSRERCDCISDPNDNDEYSDESNEWRSEEEDDAIDWDEERMDIIGQNGNEGTHYGIATDEDMEECELNEKQLKDYKGVYVERPHFDWNDEELDWPQPNDKLKEAAQKYSEEFDDYGKRITTNKKNIKKTLKSRTKNGTE
jgi:hypothetical protein